MLKRFLPLSRNPCILIASRHGASNTKETAMTKQTKETPIETAQRLFEEHGMDHAMMIADSFASNSSVASQRFHYWMVVKALKEVKADME